MGKSAINPAVVGKHSTDIAALKNDLGIVEDGDTATHTIAQGQYVIWQGALYTADAAIASGTTLAASGGNKNLTAVENGGLNALNSRITPVYFGSQTFTSDNKPTIALPNDWDILYVTFYVKDHYSAFPFVIDKNSVDSTYETIFRLGFYVTSTDWARAHFKINSSRTSLTVLDSQQSGSNVGGKIIISYVKHSA